MHSCSARKCLFFSLIAFNVAFADSSSFVSALILLRGMVSSTCTAAKPASLSTPRALNSSSFWTMRTISCSPFRSVFFSSYAFINVFSLLLISSLFIVPINATTRCSFFNKVPVMLSLSSASAINCASVRRFSSSSVVVIVLRSSFVSSYSCSMFFWTFVNSFTEYGFKSGECFSVRLSLFFTVRNVSSVLDNSSAWSSGVPLSKPASSPFL